MLSTYFSRILLILIALATVTLVACSDGDSSTETSETADGTAGTAFADARARRTATNVVTISYTPTPVAGSAQKNKDGNAQRNRVVAATVHWGDNTTTRLSSANSSASHVYRSRGVFAIIIQLDSGEIIRVGDIRIKASCDNILSVENRTIREINREASGCP